MRFRSYVSALALIAGAVLQINQVRAASAPTVYVKNNSPEAIWVTWYTGLGHHQLKYVCVPQKGSDSASAEEWATFSPTVRVDVKKYGATDCNDTKGYESGVELTENMKNVIADGTSITVTVTQANNERGTRGNDIDWTWN